MPATWTATSCAPASAFLPTASPKSPSGNPPARRACCAKSARTPFLPLDEAQANHYLQTLFELQVQSLVSRVANTGLHHLVLGVSGGLDSTLALLVCHEALKQLDLPSKNLMAITMPGFGTSDRTYYNALSLISALGRRTATSRSRPASCSTLRTSATTRRCGTSPMKTPRRASAPRF